MNSRTQLVRFGYMLFFDNVGFSMLALVYIFCSHFAVNAAFV